MIPTMWLKRKVVLEALLLPAIIALAAFGAFGLGRLSALQEQQDKPTIHQAGTASTTALQ